MTPHVTSYASMAAGSQEMKVGSAVLHTVVQVPLLSLHFHVVIFFATFLVPVNTCKYTSSSVAYFGYCHDHDPIMNHQCTSLNRKQLDPLTWIFQSTTIVPVALTPCPSSSVSCEPELPNYLPTSSYLRPHIVWMIQILQCLVRQNNKLASTNNASTSTPQNIVRHK